MGEAFPQPNYVTVQTFHRIPVLSILTSTFYSHLRRNRNGLSRDSAPSLLLLLLLLLSEKLPPLTRLLRIQTTKRHLFEILAPSPTAPPASDDVFCVRRKNGKDAGGPPATTYRVYKRYSARFIRIYTSAFALLQNMYY